MTTSDNSGGGSHDIDADDIDPDIRQEGYQAGETGKQWFDCPYPSTTRESLSWMAGLVESIRDQDSNNMAHQNKRGDW